eukprot:Phypoly_transcript_17559.p1 GENE.Phypoly_transcript_17559~~Phypoly_transcript_17559.p1  ORF type:complete len:126 (+),score=9.87 Phypoly_transcript_17559:149-526(+)
MSFASAPISFRNVVRYVKDIEANAKLYQAVGFEFVSKRGDMITLKNAEGLSLILHQWSDPRPASYLDTAIGFTVKESIDEARKFVESVGFKLLRSPAAGDSGFFFIYGDLDGNPINLVGKKVSKL